MELGTSHANELTPPPIFPGRQAASGPHRAQARRARCAVDRPHAPQGPSCPPRAHSRAPRRPSAGAPPRPRRILGAAGQLSTATGRVRTGCAQETSRNANPRANSRRGLSKRQHRDVRGSEGARASPRSSALRLGWRTLGRGGTLDPAGGVCRSTGTAEGRSTTRTMAQSGSRRGPREVLWAHVNVMLRRVLPGRPVSALPVSRIALHGDYQCLPPRRAGSESGHGRRTQWRRGERRAPRDVGGGAERASGGEALSLDGPRACPGPRSGDSSTRERAGVRVLVPIIGRWEGGGRLQR